MSSFSTSLLASLRVVWLGLRTPQLYALLVLSLVLWALAYQQKTVYTVDVGGITDDAYVSGFNAKEHNEALNYRWTESTSEVRFPGIGNEPVILSVTTVGYRPSGPPPAIQVQARSNTFTVQTRGEPHTSAHFVPKGLTLENDLVVTITSPAFSPSGDPRQLGVIVDTVSVAPAEYGLRPVVIPSPGTLVGLLAGVIGLYMALLVTTRRRRYALWLASAGSALAASLLLFARPEVALLAEQLPSLLAWGLLLGLLGRAALDVLVPDGAWRADTLAGIGSASFVLAFLLRFGGMTYPQFLSSDIMLHAHNVQSVFDGRWLFTEPLPDGTPVPYPNALYVILAPLASVMGKSDQAIALLLKWFGSLLDASTCLALTWAGSRAWHGRTTAIAALIYAITPPSLVLFSAGNYSNIFGQAVLNVTLLGAIVVLGGQRTKDEGRRIDRPQPSFVLRPSSFVLAIGFALTMLGHYGMMLAAFSIMALFGVWSIWETFRLGRATAAWRLIGAFGLALVASFALYYRHFTGEMWSQWSGFFNRVAGQSSHATGGTRAGLSVNALLDFIGRRSAWIGQLPLIAAAFGVTQLGSIGRAVRALIVAWLAAAAIFALLDQVLGDTIRWYYLGAVPVALLAGRYLALLSWRGKTARLLVALTLLTTLYLTLTFWIGNLIFTQYH